MAQFETKRETPVLLVRSLVKSYGDIRALDGIDLDIPAGKIIGLLGPNGSGKTTLIKLVAGLLRQNEGEILVKGKPVGKKSRSLVAYLPERNSIPEHFRVSEALDYFADFFEDFDRERAERMLSSLGIRGGYYIKNLSKGMKEKVQLVMVMARRAKLYLLDEPISGVDPAARDFILSTIISNVSPDSSVLISTHLITDIERVLDGFVLVKNGRIVAEGTPKGLYDQTGKTLDEYFREVFKC